MTVNIKTPLNKRHVCSWVGFNRAPNYRQHVEEVREDVAEGGHRLLHRRCTGTLANGVPCPAVQHAVVMQTQLEDLPASMKWYADLPWRDGTRQPLEEETSPGVMFP